MDARIATGDVILKNFEVNGWDATTFNGLKKCFQVRATLGSDSTSLLEMREQACFCNGCQKFIACEFPQLVGMWWTKIKCVYKAPTPPLPIDPSVQNLFDFFAGELTSATEKIVVAIKTTGRLVGDEGLPFSFALLTKAPWVLAKKEDFDVDKDLKRTFQRNTTVAKVKMLTNCNANGLDYYAESQKQIVVSLDSIILPLTQDLEDTDRFNYLGLAVTFQHLAGRRIQLFTVNEEKVNFLHA
jgi:hypothetical protein